MTLSTTGPESEVFVLNTTKEPDVQPSINDGVDDDDPSLIKRLTRNMKGFGSRHALKAFAISLTGLILAISCGTFTILVYVTDIFNRTGSSLSEKNSSILISFTTLFANFCFVYIVERFNRKVYTGVTFYNYIHQVQLLCF